MDPENKPDEELSSLTFSQLYYLCPWASWTKAEMVILQVCEKLTFILDHPSQRCKLFVKNRLQSFGRYFTSGLANSRQYLVSRLNLTTFQTTPNMRENEQIREGEIR
jgi:hypothetical protein